jgi:hypothetical protein
MALLVEFVHHCSTLLWHDKLVLSADSKRSDAGGRNTMSPVCTCTITLDVEFCLPRRGAMRVIIVWSEVEACAQLL